MLPVLKVFGVENGTLRTLRGSDDHGVPKRELPAGFELKSFQKEIMRVGDDLLVGKVINEASRFLVALPLANEVDEEFLQHLDAERGVGRMLKRIAHGGGGDRALFAASWT